MDFDKKKPPGFFETFLLVAGMDNTFVYIMTLCGFCVGNGYIYSNFYANLSSNDKSSKF
jgi:hypothetical protein